jgi:hypothetical protein
MTHAAMKTCFKLMSALEGETLNNIVRAISVQVADIVVQIADKNDVTEEEALNDIIGRIKQQLPKLSALNQNTKRKPS